MYFVIKRQTIDYNNQLNLIIHFIAVGCIWQFNCCIQEKAELGMSENVCYKTFNRCKMVVMGMMPMDDDDEGENGMEEDNGM